MEKKKKNPGREDGIFVHPENSLNGLIRNGALVAANSLQPISSTTALSLHESNWPLFCHLADFTTSVLSPPPFACSTHLLSNFFFTA